MNYTLINAYENQGDYLTRYPLAIINNLGYNGHEGGKEKAYDLAGVEIQYHSKATAFDVTIDTTTEGYASLYIGSFSVGRIKLEAGLNHINQALHERYINLKPDIEGLLPNNLFRIILESGYKVRSIEVLDKTAKAYQDKRPKYCVYGSSFTQGVGSFAYPYCYAALLSNFLNVQILNKGLSGNCLAESSTADYLASLDVDAYILELGCNMRGYMDEQEFEKRIDYLLKKIAETKKKVYIISSLAFFVKEFAVFGPTAPYYEKNINFTKILAKLARKYNLKLIPMTKLMKEFSDVSADMLHPSLKGHLAIATNLAKIIKKG